MKKQPYQLGVLVKPLVSAGYTVFRNQPSQLSAVPVSGTGRRIRSAQFDFVRFHATRFGIAPDRIGAVGAT